MDEVQKEEEVVMPEAEEETEAVEADEEVTEDVEPAAE